MEVSSFLPNVLSEFYHIVSVVVRIMPLCRALSQCTQTTERTVLKLVCITNRTNQLTVFTEYSNHRPHPYTGRYIDTQNKQPPLPPSIEIIASILRRIEDDP